MVKHLPPQHQDRQPGLQDKMYPKPKTSDSSYKGSNKLKDKVALISGGDSGIGRAVAVAFAKEGANVFITYLDEHEDAEETVRLVDEVGQKCMAVPGDIGDEKFCEEVVNKCIDSFGQLDILVNNAAVQFPQDDLLEISAQQLHETFRINFYSYFYLSKAALRVLKKGSCIINTTSVTAYKGSAHLIDYSATKGAIVAFTRSLSESLIKKEIRVNAVAPGPIWTPLIPASFSKEEVAKFGEQVPMHRPGQPSEIAPSYVFLASRDSSYMTGQVLHPNGGVIVNG